MNQTETPVPPTQDNTVSLDEARARMHRQMLSSVSHDLKTPLASIIGSLEVYERMRDKLPVDKQETLIKVALQEAYRLDSFITNILDMAKFDNGLVRMQRETTNLHSIVKNCIMRLDYRLQNCAVVVEPHESVIDISTDPVILSRALMLILDNAVKYSGDHPAINIRYGKDKTHGFIEVRDNGPGIAESRMEVIFSKYTRFATQDQQGAGTGLGLAICREIMRLLDGAISVANYPSGGSVFTLRFLLG